MMAALQRRVDQIVDLLRIKISFESNLLLIKFGSIFIYSLPSRQSIYQSISLISVDMADYEFDWRRCLDSDLIVSVYFKL